MRLGERLRSSVCGVTTLTDTRRPDETQPVGVADILQDPLWFLDDMDTKDGSLSFVETTEEELTSLPFLAQNWDRAERRKVRLDPRSVLAGLPSGSLPKPSANVVWHTGFCCSTLLSRLLYKPGRHVALREPQVLLILAELKRYNYLTPSRIDPRLLDAALHLLSRPFTAGGQVLLKPANASNHLMSDLARRTTGKMLCLFSDCRSFLISIAKREEAGMRFARRGFTIIAGDGNAQFNWPVDELMRLSDLRIAALMWHMQIAEFRRSWPLMEGRAVSLDCDAFLADPMGVLGKLDQHFGLPPDSSYEAARAALLQKDAKVQGQPYTAERRRDEYRLMSEHRGEDLDRIVAWSYEVCPETPRGAPLPNPVASLEKAYHP